MLVTFFKFGNLVATEPKVGHMTSDPISLGDNDRVTVQPIVHYFNGPNNPEFAWQVESSQNGQDWINVSGLTKAYDQAGSTLFEGAVEPETKPVYAAYIRVSVEYAVNGIGTDAGGIGFDLIGFIDQGRVA